VLFANRSNQQQLLLRLDRDNERQRKEALRNKLEELYTLIEKWAGTTVIHHITLRKVMDGDITYNQALDLQLDREIDFDVNRMFMLAELYFDTCHNELNNIKNIRDEASDIQNEFKEMHRHSGRTSEKYSGEITKILDQFNFAIDAYKQALREYAKKV
jgi:septation ring formation regulator EzrA